MVNAGRILILAKGPWDSLTHYDMLDLVTYDNIAYLARQESVGVNPQTDTSYTYWQPFGSAAQIATTATPGIVMPDGTTITIDNTGLISAALAVADIKDVVIAGLANGDILQYNSTSQKWENVALGTAATKDSTNAVTENSTDLVESGAVFDSVNETQNIIAPVEKTSSASQAYSIGDQLIYNGVLYDVTATISASDTLTVGTNIQAADNIVDELAGKEPASKKLIQTLAAGSTTVTFTDAAITATANCELKTDPVLNYTAIDTSITNTVIVTFPAQSAPVSVMLIIGGD